MDLSKTTKRGVKMYKEYLTKELFNFKYQVDKPKSYRLMKDKIKAYNKLQELKRIDKKRKRTTALKELLFVVGLFAAAYLLLLIGSI